jgi:hypothetical protein
MQIKKKLFLIIFYYVKLLIICLEISQELKKIKSHSKSPSQYT